MPPPGRAFPDLASLLARVEEVSPVEAVDALADELADRLDADQVCFLILDLGGRAVARFAGSRANAARDREEGEPHAITEDLAGSPAERVLRSQLPERDAYGDGVRLTVPVTDRGDAIGVVELALRWRPDERDVAAIVELGRAMAYVVVACRRYTDLFEWAQRSTPFSLAAEIQRRLLPDSYTCQTGQLTVAGWLEPADAVGGDTFDYSLERDTLHVSITDAVGHDVHAATLATVLVGSLRNGRRNGLDLAAQARGANDALYRHSPAGEFVTGQLARVDLATGALTMVNAGHPAPYRLRDGRVEEIGLAVDLPFGLEPGREFTLQPVPLEPGDRILLVTDGVLERGAAALDVAAELVATADRHPREVVFTVGEAVLRATGGRLRDDATVVCLDWRGGPHRVPDANGVPRQPGADAAR
ncbi:MAG: PP2C family protein-serine/threonine phosphatase [Pseudonocardiales bacterium]|nr:PP2C family protein-serine/threonine phosphatase [Pseudonocardiales bacterium]